MANCDFCGQKLKPGTGFLFVKKEGTAILFCSRKCEKNMLVMKRKPVATKWTEAYRLAKSEGKAEKKKPVKEAPAEEKKAEPKKGRKKRVRKKKKKR